MNVSTLPQSMTYSRIGLPSFLPQYGAIPLVIYADTTQVLLSPRPGVGSPVLPLVGSPTSIIPAPVIQQTMRSTAYPSSPLKIRNVTPRVVGVVST